MTSAVSTFVGHEHERHRIEALLDAKAPEARALLLDGEAGIGKTTLWRWGANEAAARGYLVLRCQRAETELTLPFAALNDLLGPMLGTQATGLAPAEHLALEAALSTSVPTQAFARLAVLRAALALLRCLAAHNHLLLAIDDVQWLDRESAAVLEYALRRLTDTPIRLLLSRRSERDSPPPLGLDRALSPEQHTNVRVEPLQIGELDQMLQARLGLALPRPRLVELHRVSGGNPFYALEIARALQQFSTPLTDPIAVPDSLAGLVRARLARLSPDARHAALLASAASHPSIEFVQRAAGGTEGLTEAIESSVLELEAERLRFSHPLLATVAYTSALPWDRRAAHKVLAEACLDPEEKALHLARSTDQPDAGVAALLDAAAEFAARRGAPSAAADLADHACRLTPAGAAPALARRLAQSAEYHLAEGDTARGRALLEDAAEQSVEGPVRAQLLLRLGRARYIEDNVGAAHALFQQARTEAGEDLRPAASAEQALAFTAMFGGDIARALKHAESSLRLAEQIGEPDLLALALGRVAVNKFLLGRGLDREMIERAVGLEPYVDAVPVEWLPRYVYAGLASWISDFATARRLYGELYQAAIEQSDERSIPTLLFAMSQLESAAGNLDLAGRQAGEAVERSRQSGLSSLQCNALSAQCLASALLGQTAIARAAAKEGLQIAAQTGAVAPLTWLTAHLGFLELSLGDHTAAHARLEPLAGMVVKIGVGEPTIVRFLPDEIEALIAMGELEEARQMVAMLEERGRALDRPWALVTGARSAALLAAADGAFDAAEEALDRAFQALARLPEPVERGRTLLVAGAIARRARRWHSARTYLSQALDLFDALGAALWAERAAAELARIPGRRRAGNELSEMEERVAGLVATGLTNQEIASRLFVTVRTVESHLSKIYAKLGLRSRTELAGRYPHQNNP
jgi:DNA-binding CsgD family transcriptional regulator